VELFSNSKQKIIKLMLTTFFCCVSNIFIFDFIYVSNCDAWCLWHWIVCRL